MNVLKIFRQKIHRALLLSVCSIVLFGFAGAVQAGLLGVTPDFPRIAFDNQGTLTFDSGTMQFSVDSDPQTIKFLATDTQAAFIVDPRSFTIRILVDGGCGVAGGNPSGYDLEIIGDVLDPSTFATIKSGVLLTGTIVDIGEAVATGTTSTFDFRFNNASGLLVADGDWPAGQEIGIVLTSEDSLFTNDCTVSFNGRAKGNTGPIGPLEPPTGEPVRTQGYWKTHLEAWPLDPITVGGMERTAEEADNLLMRAIDGDKTYSMYRQLTAAILNLANGSDPGCIDNPPDITTINDANQWLIDNPLGSNVQASNPAWQDVGDALHETLDAYNNGELCAVPAD